MNTFIEIEDELKPDHKYHVAYCRKAVYIYSTVNSSESY